MIPLVQWLTEQFWLWLFFLGIVSAGRVYWIAMRHRWQWYRRWCGGHWEQWYIDIPVGVTTWINEAYCQRGDRPGLGRGTPTCEDWPKMRHPYRAILGVGRFFAYGKYLMRHKWFVFRAAWRMRLPWRVKLVCALHDASKFRPSEWGPYSCHFNLADGTSRSSLGSDGFLDHPKDDPAFNRAWLAHYQRNKHHPQHWVTVTWAPCHHVDSILIGDNGKARCLFEIWGFTCGGVYGYSEVGSESYRTGDVQVMIDEMPEPYLSEMLCDWMGAGLAQGNPDTLGWYALRGINHPMGPKTRAIVEKRLGYPDDLPLTTGEHQPS